MERPEGVEEHFDGAGSAATSDLYVPHVCVKCNVGYDRYDQVAYLTGDNQFHVHNDTLIARTIESDGGAFVNSASIVMLHMTCVNCCEDLMKMNFHIDDGTVSASWQNQAKASKKTKLSNQKKNVILD